MAFLGTGNSFILIGIDILKKFIQFYVKFVSYQFKPLCAIIFEL